MAVTRIQDMTTDTGLVRGTALGDVRLDIAPPRFDLRRLADAVKHVPTHGLSNPNNSPGCSPFLRAFFVMSGLPFGINRELANTDGGDHRDGNAIDLVAASPTLNVEAALGELIDVTRVILAFFTVITHLDTDGFNTIAYGGATTAQSNNAQTNVHVASSLYAIRYALMSSETQTFRDQLEAMNTESSPFRARAVHFDSDTMEHNKRGNSAQDGIVAPNSW